MDETVNNVPRRPSPVLTRQFSVINSSKLPDLLLKSNPSITTTAETSTCPDEDDNSHRVSWKTFTDRLLIRCGTSAFSETLTLDPPTPRGATTETTPGEPIRVSLMALLEKTDMMGGTGTLEKKPTTVLISSEEGEEEEEGEEMAHECCVCMVRHNGAPFVHCGHTFCRLCSRELWVVRGNYCPLCNGYILEILDVFLRNTIIIEFEELGASTMIEDEDDQ